MMLRQLSHLFLAGMLLACLPAGALDKHRFMELWKDSEVLDYLRDELKQVDQDLSSGNGGKKKLYQRRKSLQKEIAQEKKQLAHDRKACEQWFHECGNAQDINRQDSKGKTLLMHVAASGHPQAIQLILLDKPDITRLDQQGKSALDYARESGMEAEIEEYASKVWDELAGREDRPALTAFLKAHYRPTSNQLRRLLGEAIHHGDHALQEEIFKLKPPCIGQAPSGCSLLEEAIRKGNSKAIAGLLKGGADATERMSNGYTPLYHVLTHGDSACIKAFLGSMKHADEAQRRSIPALVVRYAPAEAVRELITGAGVANAEDAEMNIPIHEAARRGDMGILNIVLQRGGSRTATNAAGETTLMHAALSGSPEVLARVAEGLPASEFRKKAKDGRGVADFARESCSPAVLNKLQQLEKRP